MKKNSVFVTCLYSAVSLVACSPTGTNHSEQSMQLEPVLLDFKDNLQTELEGMLEKKKLPGAILIIAKGDEVLAEVRSGYRDVENKVALTGTDIYRLYSMSKPITSVAIMRLVEQGLIDLEEPVETYLPDLDGLRVYKGGNVDHIETVPLNRSITIQDLLTHQSGIPYHFTGTSPVHQYYRKHGVMRDTLVGSLPDDGEPAPTLTELIYRIGNAPLLHQPGTKFEYSYSTTVLGGVIEKVTGQTLDLALKALVFEPLDMPGAGFFILDDKVDEFVTNYVATAEGIKPIDLPETSEYRDLDRLLDGGGALVSTVQDYLHFTQMLGAGGRFNRQQILTKESIETMIFSHVNIEEVAPFPIEFGFGFSLGNLVSEAAKFQPKGTISWSGSGNTYFVTDTDTGLTAIFMTNVLTPNEYVARGLEFRRFTNSAFLEARQILIER